MTTTTEPLTLQAYAAMRESDARFVTELVRGRIEREPRPARLHGRVQVRLGHALDAWAARPWKASGAEDPLRTRLAA
jgi:Uma2 family endonuclease